MSKAKFFINRDADFAPSYSFGKIETEVPLFQEYFSGMLKDEDLLQGDLVSARGFNTAKKSEDLVVS